MRHGVPRKRKIERLKDAENLSRKNLHITGVFLIFNLKPFRS